jgi:hypothetical protein
MKSLCLLVLFFTSIILSAAERWDSSNRPDPILGNSYQTNMNTMPRSANLATTPWSDSYWASNKGGIANRWNSAGTPGFQYGLLSKSQLQNRDLKYLSPAEKYDLYRGRYDYPTVRSEWTRCSPNDESWEGICHVTILSYCETK